MWLHAVASATPFAWDAWRHERVFVSDRIRSFLQVVPAAVEFFSDWSNFNANAKGKHRVLRQELDGLVQVPLRHHHDACQAFLGLRKGTIRDDNPARVGLERHCGAGALQSNASEPMSALDTFLVEGDRLLHH